MTSVHYFVVFYFLALCERQFIHASTSSAFASHSAEDETLSWAEASVLGLQRSITRKPLSAASAGSSVSPESIEHSVDDGIPGQVDVSLFGMQRAMMQSPAQAALVDRPKSYASQVPDDFPSLAEVSVLALQRAVTKTSGKVTQTDGVDDSLSSDRVHQHDTHWNSSAGNSLEADKKLDEAASLIGDAAVEPGSILGLQRSMSPAKLVRVVEDDVDEAVSVPPIVAVGEQSYVGALGLQRSTHQRKIVLPLDEDALPPRAVSTEQAKETGPPQLMRRGG